MFSWAKMCSPHYEGGFNVKELLSWNKALACKWFHKLIRKRGIWAHWMLEYRLQHSSFWETRTWTSDSWSWKKLILLRDFMISKVGSLNTLATLFASWCNNEKMNITMVYDFFRFTRPITSWAKVIWDHAVIPKHAIISSLAAQSSLPTYDHLMRRGFHGPNRCTLCFLHEETVPHLFFSCVFSSAILHQILAWIGVAHPTLNYKHLLWIIRRHYGGKKWSNRFIRVALAATVHTIWLERNGRLFSNYSYSPDALVRKIKFLVSARLIHFSSNLTQDEKMDALLG